VTLTRTSAEWYAARGARQLCGILNDYAAVAADRHLNERGFFIDIDHPRAGRTRASGFPVRLSATPAQLRRPAPMLGEHTAEVLGELGLGTAEIEALRVDGVV
jgi:crotonobetainyl-CoA:carnitine CoA-transferase CaiB-like acyl-CoA transferase